MSRENATGYTGREKQRVKNRVWIASSIHYPIGLVNFPRDIKLL